MVMELQLQRLEDDNAASNLVKQPGVSEMRSTVAKYSVADTAGLCCLVYHGHLVTGGLLPPSVCCSTTQSVCCCLVCAGLH
jgi:hypothetical protein